jgi:hypothetical protein
MLKFQGRDGEAYVTIADIHRVIVIDESMPVRKNEGFKSIIYCKNQNHSPYHAKDSAEELVRKIERT